MRIPRLAFNGIFYDWKLVIPERWNERTKSIAHFVEQLLPIYSLFPNCSKNFYLLWLVLIKNITILNSNQSIQKKISIISYFLLKLRFVINSNANPNKFPIKRIYAINSFFIIIETILKIKGKSFWVILHKIIIISCNIAYLIETINEDLLELPDYKYTTTTLAFQEGFEFALKVFKLYQWNQRSLKPLSQSKLFFMFFDPCCKAILCFAKISQALHQWDEFKKNIHTINAKMEKFNKKPIQLH